MRNASGRLNGTFGARDISRWLSLAWIIYRVFIDQPQGVNQMALTLRFREPAGASPGPKFAGEFA